MTKPQLILESVGGASLGTALTLLAPQGMCVLFGESAAGAAAFSPSGFYSPGGTSLYGFYNFYEVTCQSAGQGLARLVRLVADGRLHPRIAVEVPWGEVAQGARPLMDRAYLGIAVLQVGEGAPELSCRGCREDHRAGFVAGSEHA